MADRQRATTVGGDKVSPEGAVSDIYFGFIEAARKELPVFATGTKFGAYLKARLRGKVKDNGKKAITRDHQEETAVIRQLAEEDAARAKDYVDRGLPAPPRSRPGVDGDTPSRHAMKKEDAGRVEKEAAIHESQFTREVQAIRSLKRDGWKNTHIAEAFHEDAVRPEATDDPDERARRTLKLDAERKRIARLYEESERKKPTNPPG